MTTATKRAKTKGAAAAPEWKTYFDAVLALKGTKDAKAAAKLIREHRLPREVVPTELLTKLEVWEALLPHMPMMAMVRNLATMTRAGLLGPMKPANTQVIEKLANVEALTKARVHPIALLLALRTYARGHGERGGNSWTPVQPIVDALDEAFYASFAGVEPTGVRMMVSLDVSGSMNAPITGGIMSCTEVGAAMALVLAATEPQALITSFDTACRPMPITKRMRLDDVLRKAREHSGGTDVAQPILYAKQHKIPVDCFVILTDSETWAGRQHPQVALEAYRKSFGIQSKMVVCAAAANQFSVGDSQKDPNVLDIVGFDANAPTIVNTFARD